MIFMEAMGQDLHPLYLKTFAVSVLPAKEAKKLVSPPPTSRSPARKGAKLVYEIPMLSGRFGSDYLSLHPFSKIPKAVLYRILAPKTLRNHPICIGVWW